MKKQKEFFLGIALALLAIAAVFITEQVIKPGYAIKSAIKVLSFMGAALLYCKSAHRKPADVFRLCKLENPRPLLLYMLCFFVGTAAAFLIFKDFLDLPAIRQSLMTKENLTKENCVFVFLYIIFCNSFLEESFFRGFVSGIFPDRKTGGIVSALLFSLYHIGIFVTWFSPLIFLLCLAGLAAVGLFLQWLSEKYKSVFASYITHACANVAIDIIGALLIFERI